MRDSIELGATQAVRGELVCVWAQSQHTINERQRLACRFDSTKSTGSRGPSGELARPCCKSSRGLRLTLTLFVAGIATNHEHDATTAHDLTALTNTLDAGADLHGGCYRLTKLAICPKRLNISPKGRWVQVPSARNLLRNLLMLAAPWPARPPRDRPRECWRTPRDGVGGLSSPETPAQELP